jgi:S-adenosylmethionine synthetase
MSNLRLFTSESVSEGHPDKVADQISDAILDALLEKDPQCRTAIETLLGRGFAVVTGEMRTEAYVEIADIVRDTVTDIGYTDMTLGMDGHTCGVLVSVQSQSREIAMGVDTGGAGDQGMMFGYATDETPELMPLPLAMAHAFMRKQAEVKRDNLSRLRPDAKAQVTIGYDNISAPKKVDAIVCSCQHAPMERDEMVNRIHSLVIDPVLSQYTNMVDCDSIQFHINPTGSFELGGPAADSGLTGRKIIVDTYGGFCPHGGGAFSGKDPTKVDRSAAYMCRHVAKNIVAAGLAKRAQVSVAYAIGVADPVQISVDTFGTETMSVDEIEARIRDVFPFSPRGIAEHLGLRKPGMKYLPTAKNGHFGNPAFPWESTDPAALLQKAKSSVGAN